MAKKGLGKGLGAIFGEDVVKRAKKSLKKQKRKGQLLQRRSMKKDAFLCSNWI